MFFGNSYKLKEEISEKNDLIKSLQLSIKELNAELKAHKKLQERELRVASVKLENTECELEEAHEELENLHQKYEELVSLDSMTNTYNKRYFYDIVEPIISLSKREKHHLSLMTISIDNLENMASAVTQVIVHAMSDKVRESDVFVKFDEKTFVILLPHTTLEQAKIMSEKLRISVKEIDEIDSAQLSISIGIAEFINETDNIDATLKRSHDALLRAIEGGGNQVQV